VGWTAGAGIEASLWWWNPNPRASNWTAKLEYLHIDLGTRTINTVDIDGAPFAVSNRVRDDIVRIGVNYHFWPTVVAKY
jgi:outer membrane immunogenic protein